MSSTPHGSSSGFFSSLLADAEQALRRFRADDAADATVRRFTALLSERFAAGNKVLICGNGGSSCDANHFAEELTGRFRADRPPLPALACVDAGHITCTANDYGFDHIFSRWITALGRPGDVFIALSTSGDSANIVNAVHAAKAVPMITLALLGRTGGALAGACDHQIIAPGATSDRIQEIHMIILHALVEGVERTLFPSTYSK